MSALENLVKKLYENKHVKEFKITGRTDGIAIAKVKYTSGLKGRIVEALDGEAAAKIVKAREIDGQERFNMMYDMRKNLGYSQQDLALVFGTSQEIVERTLRSPYYNVPTQKAK